MILLTDSEMKALAVKHQTTYNLPILRDIRDTQAQHFWKYLNEPCTEHPLPFKMAIVEQYKLNGKWYFKHRRDCKDCREQIEKELKE